MAKKTQSEETIMSATTDTTPEKTPEEKRADAIAKAESAVQKADAALEAARTEHDRTQAKLTLADINLAKARQKLARLQAST